MRDNRRIRFQFDFSPEGAERLEQLRERLEASSKAEVVRLALKLLDRVLIAHGLRGASALKAIFREFE